MADISKINPNGTEYNLKDATARSDISAINDKIPSNASSSNKLATITDIPDLGLSVVNGELCVTYEE